MRMMRHSRILLAAIWLAGCASDGEAMDSVTGKVTLTFDPQGVLLDYAISGRS